MSRKLLILVLILFVAIQFVPISINDATKVPASDFILSTNPPEEIATLFKTSCYDCHSNTSNYPWYDKVAPVSWWIAAHIYEGKGGLNLSKWGRFSEKQKKHVLEEIVEEIEKEKMPLESYLLIHGEAKVTNEQLKQLKEWIETIN